MTATALTNGALLERCQMSTQGIEHLDLEVPVLTGPQAQGDVLVLPTDRAQRGAPVPAEGMTIVRGETAGGNAHILHALEGDCLWQAAEGAQDGLTQGHLTVPDGGSAMLIHTQEHSVLGIGPGCYEIRREREFAGEWRRVSD